LLRRWRSTAEARRHRLPGLKNFNIARGAYGVPPPLPRRQWRRLRAAVAVAASRRPPPRGGMAAARRALAAERLRPSGPRRATPWTAAGREQPSHALDSRRTSSRATRCCAAASRATLGSASLARQAGLASLRCGCAPAPTSAERNKGLPDGNAAAASGRYRPVSRCQNFERNGPVPARRRGPERKKALSSANAGQGGVKPPPPRS
jgi:hypothetical protein